MFQCKWCGAEFEDPEQIRDGYFAGNPMVHLVCPECGDDEFYEIEENEDDGEV